MPPRTLRVRVSISGVTFDHVGDPDDDVPFENP